MKNKTTIINIILAVMLAFSIIFNVILFNGISTAKKNLIGAQNQLDKSKVQVKNAQVEWKTLQARIEDAKKENARLIELKKEQALITVSQVKADPNKKLRGGITLWEAKKMLEKHIKTNEEGQIKKRDKEFLDMMAGGLGTTLEEVMSCPDTRPEPQPQQQVQPQQPQEQQEQTQQPQQQAQQSTPKPSNNGGGKVGVPGSFPVTDWDKNGDGIKDSLAGHMVSGEITVQKGEHKFNLKAHGDK